MRGSITVFATLVLMLVSQFLFTALEAGRNIALSNIARMNSEAVAESVFAQYCRPMWDEYRLLTYDAGSNAAGGVNLEEIETYMKTVTTENFQISTDDTISLGTSLLRLSMDETDFSQYALMTDDNGGVYVNEIVSYMKKNMGYEVAKGLYGQYQSINDSVSNSKYDDKGIDDAIGSLKNSGQSQGAGKSISRPSPVHCAPTSSSKKSAAGTASTTDDAANTVENPLVKVKQVKAGGILSQVVSESTVSGNTISTSDRVSSRNLNKGTGDLNDSEDWYAKILMQQYFLTYMSNYTSHNEDTNSLVYELEYIISGACDDKTNLQTVVTEILAIREAANLAYLIGSPAKQAEALALATALAAITLNPAIVEAVKWGLLIGWAYCESVLDVRALLAGDKIPMIKSDATWTSGLSGMGDLLSGNAKAKSSEFGIGYTSYLGVLLFTKSTKTLAYRAMDVQEATVRQIEGYENFRMDNCICKMSADVTYKYHGIFLCFVNLLNGASDEFSIKNKAQYSYYD